MLISRPPTSRTLRLAALLALVALAPAGRAAEPAGEAAAALLGKYAAVRERMAHSEFGGPLHLESSDNAGHLEGDVYALVDHPYAAMAGALGSAADWCEFLTLHLNVKYCGVPAAGGGAALTLYLGRKYFQSLPAAYRIDFNFHVAARSPGYLEVTLSAPKGPLGTSDYRMSLEAAPLDAAHSFVHFSYAYSYGFAARLAMRTYLATFGEDKIGFTRATQSDGRAVYVQGVRGVLERNCMRYFLALEAYLGALAAPPAERLQQRLNDWFERTERYAPQLHEVSRSEYLEMKREEFQRQRAEAG